MRASVRVRARVRARARARARVGGRVGGRVGARAGAMARVRAMTRDRDRGSGLQPPPLRLSEGEIVCELAVRVDDVRGLIALRPQELVRGLTHRAHVALAPGVHQRLACDLQPAVQLLR